MNTNDIPKVHPELLDALHRQDEQAQQMKFSEGFTEKVMSRVKNERVKNERMKNEKFKLLFTLRKIAAIFFAVVCLGSLAFAAYRVFAPQTYSPQPAQVTTPSLQGRAGGGSSIRFSDIRLDSILTVVSAHYGKAVCFRNEESRSMKLITTWNPEDSLAAFIEHLNMFDYLHLTLKDDTIFVEQTGEED